MRKARVRRLLFALIAAVSFAAMMPTKADAQFLANCVGTPGVSITCTNFGVEPADFPPGPPTVNFDFSAINFGTAQNVTINTAVTGNALVNNFNTALDLTADAVGTGNATVLNSNQAGNLFARTDSGTATVTNAGVGASANSILARTDLGGNAVSNNSGTIATDIDTITFGGGNATTNNSGTVLGKVTTHTFSDGNATLTNTGKITGNILTRVEGVGNAATYNYGSARSIATQAETGSATSNNYGTTDFMNARTTNGGDAFAFNSGTVVNASGGNLALPGFPFKTGILAYAANATGNATAINTGTAASTNPNRLGMMAVTNGGDALSINYGSTAGIYTVSGLVSGNGSATTINYGTVTGGIISESNYNFAGTGNAYVFNSGRVFAGVAAFADDLGTAIISNAGLIDGTNASGGIAVTLHNQFNPRGPSTLNILPGSRIIGLVDLNGNSLFPGTGTQVNFFSGRDILSTLTFGGGCGCGPNNLIDTGSVVNVFGGAPFVIVGNTVSVLDPTSFAVQDKNLVDFSHTISSMVTSRLNNPAPMSGGSTPIGFAPSGNVAVDMARDAFAGISSLNYA